MVRRGLGIIKIEGELPRGHWVAVGKGVVARENGFAELVTLASISLSQLFLNLKSMI